MREQICPTPSVNQLQHQRSYQEAPIMPPSDAAPCNQTSDHCAYKRTTVCTGKLILTILFYWVSWAPSPINPPRVPDVNQSNHPSQIGVTVLSPPPSGMPGPTPKLQQYARIPNARINQNKIRYSIPPYARNNPATLQGYINCPQCGKNIK